MNRADVVILGGGPAGTAAALTLARYSNLKAVVFERGDYSGKRVGEVIGPGVMPLLDYLGVANIVTHGKARAGLATAAAWGSDNVLTYDLLFSGRGDGWQLDRNHFDGSLAGAAHEAGACVHTESRVRGVMELDNGRWQITAKSSAGADISVLARYLIEASGRRATFARALGAKREPIDRLVGIYGYVQFPSARTEDAGLTLIESVPDGWWYSTWLPDDTLAVSFMSDADLARNLHAQNVANWIGLLAQAPHTRERVVGGQRPVQLFSRSAASHQLRPAGGAGWLAAGDALAAFDPLSSLGIGYALSSGASAARAAVASLGGDDCPTGEFIANSARHFGTFLEMHTQYYQMEQRWRDLPFWSRRHGRASA